MDRHSIAARYTIERFALHHYVNNIAPGIQRAALYEYAQYLTRIDSVRVGQCVPARGLRRRCAVARRNTRERVAALNHVIYLAIVRAFRGFVGRGQFVLVGQRLIREPVHIDQRAYARHAPGLGILKARPKCPARIAFGRAHAVICHPQRVFVKWLQQIFTRAVCRRVYHGRYAGQLLHSFEECGAHPRERRRAQPAIVRQIGGRACLKPLARYDPRKVFGLSARGGFAYRGHEVIEAALYAHRLCA